MRIVASIFLVFLLCACAPKPASDDLSREYAKAARKVNIIPVYPPREEFQVGDIFMVSVSRSDPEASVSVWLGSSKPILRAAENFLSTRVVLAATGIADPEFPASNTTTQKDLFSPELSTRSQERVLSLPIAAFPSVTHQAGYTASTGLVAAMVALGFGASEQTTVTLDFNDVRTYWVPNVIARDLEESALTEVVNILDRGAEEMLRQVAQREYNQGRKLPDRCLRLAIVTRVYLTREIDYTYRDRQILAAGLKFAADEKKLGSVAAPPTINVQIVKSGAASGSADEIDAEFAETAKNAEEIRAAVVTATGNTAQGGSFSFASWNARGLTFKQQYQRPVAIGWDGFEFDLPPRDYMGQPSCAIGGLGIMEGGQR